ncbi:MAG: 4a-hydroxytetrahydrobiopterin dehydratase [Propionibacteriales bacterium]|nr:4a-hydroxytetrahydrobiopterin dehydratase [Propionibacteriales bacterium]
MSRLLEPTEVATQLADHQHWTVDDALTGQFTFDDFSGSLTFVNAVADEAEQMDHHPDIDIRYDKVTLTVTSHDAGGLTQLDVELAKRVDQIFEKR